MAAAAVTVLAASVAPPVAAHTSQGVSEELPTAAGAQTPEEVAADEAERAAVGVPAQGAPTDPAALRDGWWRSSDVAYDAKPTLGGYEIVVAREAERWEWKPLAVVRPAGLGDTDLTGYHCVTGDGAWIVAVVAPISAVNTPWRRDRGGWAYRISTESGEVTPLRAGVAVKYHTPGCGTTSEVALISHLGVDQERTRVEVVDLASTKTTSKAAFDGQLTNAVPDGDRVVAARDKGVVALSGPTETVIAETPGTPFDLRASREGVAFLVAERERTTASVWSSSGTEAREVARGPLGAVTLATGDSGEVLAVGPGIEGQGSDAVRIVPTSSQTGPRVEVASRQGNLVVVNPTREQTGAATIDPTHSDVPNRLAVRPDTDATLSLVAAAPGAVAPTFASSEVPIPAVDPADADVMGPPEPQPMIEGDAVSETLSSDAEAAPPADVPGEASPKPGSVAPDAGEIAPAFYDQDMPAQLSSAQWTTPKCAVPRNALNRQVPQPNADQVDWAIQQATRNKLKLSVLTRPAGFANLGLVSYQPSSDFVRHQLHGSASSVPVPPSVIQGTYAQESNWKQATKRALPGVSGNPEIGDYYGADGTLDYIDYDGADCGYGIAQVTDPMTTASGAYSANGKTKVAVDYAENVAAGIQFLVDKWNVLWDEGVKFNGGNPDQLENWWGALWAYNSGYNAPDGYGNEGLGWTNNPINADYPADRIGFLRQSYADAAHPGDWSYPERVAGWMEYPQLDWQGNSMYAVPLYGVSVSPQQLALPAIDFFCTDDNECDPDYLNGNLSFCTRGDRHCWWHFPDTWVVCPDYCATSDFTVSDTATEPAGSDNYPPNCNGVPPSADPPRAVIIVDDQPNNVNVEGCSQSGWTNGGTFSVTYGTSGAGAPLGQIDWHQLGTGFGGHTWFTKNRIGTDTPRVNSATWTPSSLSSGLYTVQVHIPPSGASTESAHYKVWTDASTSVDRYVNQHLHENRWVTLGSFNLGSGAKVELSNVTGETVNYTTNVAFDAVAFVPTRGTPQSVTVESVAIFDRDQNLDTTNHMFVNSPLTTEAKIAAWADGLINGSGGNDGILDYPACAGTPNDTCVGSNTRSAVADWATQIASVSKPTWLGYPNDDPPIEPTAGYFDDPENHKQRNLLQFDFLVDGGQIVPESMVIKDTHVTGTGHMPQFMVEFMEAIEDDYGIAAPDLEVSLVNVGTYTHRTSTFDPLASGGAIPGRAYRPFVTSPTYGGACATIASIDGGANPWKAFLNEGAVAGGVEAWSNLVADGVGTGDLPAEVADMADDIYHWFFSNHYQLYPDPGYDGSLFRMAPPIWVEQHIEVCADGSVAADGTSVATNSYMPDLYTYVNGHAVDSSGTALSGSPSNPATPIATGNFVSFANAGPPAGYSTDRPWELCGGAPSEPRSGNPWGMTTLGSSEAKGDDVSLCSDPQVHYHGE